MKFRNTGCTPRRNPPRTSRRSLFPAFRNRTPTTISRTSAHGLALQTSAYAEASDRRDGRLLGAADQDTNTRYRCTYKVARRLKTIAPATMVATGAPRKLRPANGEWRD